MGKPGVKNSLMQKVLTGVLGAAHAAGASLSANDL
jgi:hypothetical protein